MKDTIIDTTEDLYLEHSQHLVYQSNCSECYNCPPEVELVDGIIQRKLSDVKNITSLISQKLNEDSCEVERERDDYQSNLY